MNIMFPNSDAPADPRIRVSPQLELAVILNFNSVFYHGSKILNSKVSSLMSDKTR